MSATGRGFRVLGVSILAALGMMTLMASAAHAETELKVAGKLLEANETFSGASVGTWLLIVPSRNMIMHCNKRLYVGSSWLWIPRRWDDFYLYEECVTLIFGVSVPACEVKEFTVKAQGTFILHNGKTYMLVAPEEGQPLATIKFGAECSLGETVKLTGSYVEECTEVSCETEAVAHTMKVASSALFTSDVLKFGTSEATLEGTEKVELSGKNKGQKWSIVN